MDIENKVEEITTRARKSVSVLCRLSSDKKEEVLKKMADELVNNAGFVIQENEKDLNTASEINLSGAMIDRLKLDNSKIKSMAGSLKEIASLSDPVGEVKKMWRRPNGLKVGRLTVPIGVIGIIYESRPNVTSDCIGLCLKSGNSVVLRGGKEAINSNKAIFRILHDKAIESELPEGCFNFIDFTDREAVEVLLKDTKNVDLIIPRGGEGLIKVVTQKSQVPVIKHYKGVCHTYVDKYADLEMARKVCYNAKVQKPGVCNAMETMLVHKDIAEEFLPTMIEKFNIDKVELRGCSKSQQIDKRIKKASYEDWDKEYLRLILAVKVVENFQQAVDHITKYGSNHSDAIITENYSLALKFLQQIDSACVFVNASTRFTDGNQFGLGAEMGVSTEKIHARGPMGVNELTTYKYIVLGNGQIRK